jgi:hypothetical protein
MAISPKKLLQEITEQEEQTLESLEKKIDADLQKKFNGESVYISVSGEFYKLRKPAQDNLLNRYLAQGWTRIALESDQREGSYLVFEYKSAKKSARERDMDMFPR